MRTLHATILALSTFAALAAFAPVASAQDAKAAAGDAKAGEGKAAMCIGCHGIPFYQASFPEVHKVPMISGQSGKYITAALNAYKKGERKHPTMRSIAETLTDQDVADLSAFYEAHVVPGKPVPAKAEPEPSAKVAELLKKANCASCHGENFSKPIDPSYPKIAGQHADYLYVALKSYQVSNGTHVGRANPIMAGMANQYKHAELKQLAKYLASLPGELQTVPQSRTR